MNTSPITKTITAPDPISQKQPQNPLGDFWGAFGGLFPAQNAANLSENDSTVLSSAVHQKIRNGLEQVDLRNKKGIEAAHKLFMSEIGLRHIADAVKANQGNRDQYISGLLNLTQQYDSGAACSVRAICQAAAIEGLSTNLLETKIAPILVELGIIVRHSEKSSQWQAYDRIGKHESQWLKTAKALLEVSDERLELRRQQAKAADEARLLDIAKKQLALAQQRKQLAMNAAHAAAEAERITATLPEDHSPSTWMKSNLMPLVIMGLFGAVMISGLSQGTGTPGNSPSTPSTELASFGNNPVNPASTPANPHDKLPKPTFTTAMTQEAAQ
ncbi:hypothetical protein [Thiolinea disciformis]|uniref:hypothetical protein n=1 Tax=Thiolinea disciformis TaxID=125614 RepID=UPI000372A829|nr:hypothetical protein [Thiolinea disciformis]